MPPLRVYRLFISHGWRYGSDSYERLIQLLRATPKFVFKDYSVPRSDPVDARNATQIALALSMQIRQVNIMILLAGMYAHRDWIQQEIEIAQSYNKPIIAVEPRGAERIPSFIDDVALRPRPNNDTGGEVIFPRMDEPIRRMLGGIRDLCPCPCEMTDVAPSERPDLAA